MSLYDGEEKIVLEFVSMVEDEPETDGIYVKSVDGNPPTIQVAGGRTHFSIVWTIFHELLHRWEEVYTRNLNHAELDDIARYMARVLTNSPQLIDYIKGQTRGGKRGRK